MELIIVTGLSGAGKTQAADVLEDLGYFVMDNVPVLLIGRMAEFALASGSRFEKLAVVTDIRSQSSFDALFSLPEELHCRILFMDASTPVLVKRYKESRRPHPLQTAGLSIEESVEQERKLLEEVRSRARWIIDSGNLTLGQLRRQIGSYLNPDGEARLIPVTLMSFGYKHGIPLEADLVLDVRFLPNPYYVSGLRECSGMDTPVADFIFQSETSREFLRRTQELIEFLLPHYTEEGKHTFTVAVGCTGGRHRSVAVANALSGSLRAFGCRAELINRDMEK